MKKTAFHASAALLLVIALSVVSFSRNSIWRDVVSLCGDINAKAPEKGRAFALLGSHYARSGDLANAVASYQEALTLRPLNAKLYIELAKVYRQAGDDGQEYITFQRALLAGVQDAGIHRGLGDLLFRNMDMEGAAREFGTAIDLDPMNAYAYYKVGLIDMARGRYRDSLSRFQKAASLDPGNEIYQKYVKTAFALMERK